MGLGFGLVSLLVRGVLSGECTVLGNLFTLGGHFPQGQQGHQNKTACWIQWLGFPCGSVVKNLPANAGDAGDSSLMPWTEEPGGLQPVEVAKSQTWLNHWTCMHNSETTLNCKKGREISARCLPRKKRPVLVSTFSVSVCTYLSRKSFMFGVRRRGLNSWPCGMELCELGWVTFWQHQFH